MTVNTDASFCPRTKRGAFAFYIKSDQFFVKVGGVLQRRLKNCHVAEVLAIGNALYGLMHTYEGRIDLLVVNTDSLHAINNLRRDYKTNYRAVRRILRQIKKKFNIKEISFRHVKGHNGSDTPRKYVNYWCDKTARKYLTIARHEYSVKPPNPNHNGIRHRQD